MILLKDEDGAPFPEEVQKAFQMIARDIGIVMWNKGFEYSELGNEAMHTKLFTRSQDIKSILEDS